MTAGGRPAVIPVLMYHDLGDLPVTGTPSHRPYVVPVSAFRTQLKIARDCGIGVRTLDAALDATGPAGDAAEQTCVITFDDGDQSNFTCALPALLDAGFRATFFVTAGWVGRAPFMSWDQLRGLADAGMEVGSHSLTHRPPATLTRAELFTEMADSKKLLEDRLGREIRSASSPTGFFNPAIVPAVMEAGYRALCIGRIAFWTRGDDRFTIPRIPVKRATGHEDFRRTILGDRSLVRRLRGEQMVRDGFKGLLGVGGYLRLRRVLLRILGGARAGRARSG